MNAFSCITSNNATFKFIQPSNMEFQKCRLADNPLEVRQVNLDESLFINIEIFMRTIQTKMDRVGNQKYVRAVPYMASIK